MASLADVNSVRRRSECCVSDIQQWCTPQRLQLNPEKTELIWFGRRRNLERLQATDMTICLGDVDIGPADCVRNLGVMLDSSLSLHQHIAKVTLTCFFHLRRLRKLSRLLDIDARKRLVCALIQTRLDYCNSALVGLPDSAFAPLQRGRIIHVRGLSVAFGGRGVKSNLVLWQFYKPCIFVALWCRLKRIIHETSVRSGVKQKQPTVHAPCHVICQLRPAITISLESPTAVCILVR